ncbi:hypothetical protein D6851_13625 [Altericroceibacterium spongiae]|uniref:Uncharacterized protein n=1 Tax=Altericroceibacterium spongiae TaxID=2320269 RepID=A0A420EEH6_9SPHN|nr:DUF6489 family protein [Altericroceibacterium spongiae]RKF19054.1 hypothetical protein D6851_13625 [Altericroceibacterium spongiae]
MKVNIEIDCTPEEARRFMGLPDVEKANEVYLEHIAKAMKGVSNADQLQEYAKQLAPMGQFGMKLFQNLMENSTAFNEGMNKSGATGQRPKNDDAKKD